MIRATIVTTVIAVVGLAIVAAPVIARFVRSLRSGRLSATSRKPGKLGEPAVCLRCGYDLRGQDVPRCPECGTLRGFKVPMEELGISEEEIRKAKANKDSEPPDG